MSDDNLPDVCKNTTPRNLGDENLAPINSRKYASTTMTYLNKNMRLIKTKDGIEKKDIPIAIINKVAEDAILQIHRNDLYPENQNIMLIDDKLYVYENDKWSIAPHSKFREITKKTFDRVLKRLHEEHELQKKELEEDEKKRQKKNMKNI